MVNQEYRVYIDFNIRNVFISITETSRYLYLTRSIQLDVSSLWKIHLCHPASTVVQVIRKTDIKVTFLFHSRGRS